MKKKQQRARKLRKCERGIRTGSALTAHKARYLQSRDPFHCNRDNFHITVTPHMHLTREII